jgi:hypothetical protein
MIFTSFSTTLISPEMSEHCRTEGRRERRANATGLDSWSVMRFIGDEEGASGVEKKRKFINHEVRVGCDRSFSDDQPAWTKSIAVSRLESARQKREND